MITISGCLGLVAFKFCHSLVGKGWVDGSLPYKHFQHEKKMFVNWTLPHFKKINPQFFGNKICVDWCSKKCGFVCIFVGLSFIYVMHFWAPFQDPTFIAIQYEFRLIIHLWRIVAGDKIPCLSRDSPVAWDGPASSCSGEGGGGVYTVRQQEEILSQLNPPKFCDLCKLSPLESFCSSDYFIQVFLDRAGVGLETRSKMLKPQALSRCQDIIFSHPFAFRKGNRRYPCALKHVFTAMCARNAVFQNQLGKWPEKSHLCIFWEWLPSPSPHPILFHTVGLKLIALSGLCWDMLKGEIWDFRKA